ncbi:MAG: hypothetical protein AAB839_02340 [Patescibacteria group bacterium]
MIVEKQHPRGAILLFNVLIMGITSIVAAAVLARGSFEGFLDSNDALATWNTRADILGCFDETLIQLKKNNDFSATTISIGHATCTLAIATPAAGQRTVTLTLTEGIITRKITATVTLGPYAVTQVTEP